MFLTRKQVIINNIKRAIKIIATIICIAVVVAFFVYLMYNHWAWNEWFASHNNRIDMIVYN